MTESETDRLQRRVVLAIQPRPLFEDMPLPPEQRMALELPRQQREFERFVKLGWRHVQE